MRKDSSETKSEIRLARLIAEAGEDARKRRQAAMKTHIIKLREIQKANSEDRRID